MKITISKFEIDSFLQDLDSLKDSVLVSTLKNNLSINGIVTFKKKLVIGNVEISFSLEAQDGRIILTITNASIAGLGIFGVVRKKAGEMIVEAINTHSGLVAVKEEGLVKISIPDFNVSFIGIVNDTLHLEMQTK